MQFFIILILLFSGVAYGETLPKSYEQIEGDLVGCKFELKDIQKKANEIFEGKVKFNKGVLLHNQNLLAVEGPKSSDPIDFVTDFSDYEKEKPLQRIADYNEAVAQANQSLKANGLNQNNDVATPNGGKISRKFKELVEDFPRASLIRGPFYNVSEGHATAGIEFFLRPSIDFIQVVPSVGIGVKIKETNVIYGCAYFDKDDPSKQHLTLYTLELAKKENLKDSKSLFIFKGVELSPLKIVTKSLAKEEETLTGILRTIPLLGDIVDLVQDLFSSGSDVVSDQIFGTMIRKIIKGASRLVVTREYTDFSYRTGILGNFRTKRLYRKRKGKGKKSKPIFVDLSPDGESPISLNLPSDSDEDNNENAEGDSSSTPSDIFENDHTTNEDWM